MHPGEKLRRARLEAGLSQRQLCEGVITRNMLSQIENGSASPSMKTLGILAERLGKNVSFFLEEKPVALVNEEVMRSARRLYDAEEYAQAALVLEAYREPDPVFDREWALLWNLAYLSLAEQMAAEGRLPYARELLQKSRKETAYFETELRRRRLLLMGQLGMESVSGSLPSLDEELQLRASEALEKQHWQRAAELLDAAENQTSESWLLLRGRTWVSQKQYLQAARCFHGAEPACPEEAAFWLELCYRELGDYRQAYNYAKKQKK